jgi:hypothetical protein
VPNEGSLLGNVVAGVNVCPIVCVSIQLQGGQVSVSGGGFGLYSRGVYVGYANRPVCSRQPTTEFASAGELFSGSVSVGVSPYELSAFQKVLPVVFLTLLGIGLIVRGT